MTDIAGALERVARRLNPAPRFDIGPLRVTREVAALRAVHGVDPEAASPSAPGEIWSGALEGTAIARVASAAVAPAYGMVALSSGEVLHTPHPPQPDFARLPYARATSDGWRLRPPQAAPRHERVALFVPWGAQRNYGQFLIHALTSLAALEHAGMLDRFTPLAPTLNAWQRALLRTFLGRKRPPVEETRASVVWADDLIFIPRGEPVPQAPGTPLDLVRARLLNGIRSAPTGCPRLYLSRRITKRRRMSNEAALESALLERGFTLVNARALSIERQVSLFRRAETIVAHADGELANVLFCAPGARVIEIKRGLQPSEWGQPLSRLVGAEWCAWSAPPASDEREAELGETDWTLPLAPFLAFLDERL